MRASLRTGSEASAVPRAPVEPPEQPTDNPRRSRGVDATRASLIDSASPSPKHQGFQISSGGPARIGRWRLGGSVAAQMPAEDGQGSYQLACKEGDRYLRILEAYMALRKARQPQTRQVWLWVPRGCPATSPYLCRAHPHPPPGLSTPCAPRRRRGSGIENFDPRGAGTDND